MFFEIHFDVRFGPVSSLGYDDVHRPEADVAPSARSESVIAGVGVIFRRAARAELTQIVELLADDDIGRHREAAAGESLERYAAAWAEMERDASNWILVAMLGEEVVGVLQLTLIAGLSRQGMKRAQIEGVRVKSTSRGNSIGKQLMQFAIRTAQEHRCGLVQLTTDKRRPSAKSFYESLGFEATHEGMKLFL